MLAALLLGIVGGFVLSIPPGPLSVAVTKKGLEGYFLAGFMIALGAALMDVVYSLISSFASSAIIVSLSNLIASNGWVPVGFQAASIVVLLTLGIRYLNKKHDIEAADKAERTEAAREERVKGYSHSSPFFLGVLIAVTNLASPTFLPSMIAFISYLHANGWLKNGAWENVVFSGGFGLGTAIWFSILLRLLVRNRKKFSANFIAGIYKFAGATFLFFAAVLTYNVIVSTPWGALP